MDITPRRFAVGSLLSDDLFLIAQRSGLLSDNAHGYITMDRIFVLGGGSLSKLQ